VTASADPDFHRLAERIASHSGLDVHVYKDRCLRRRIAVRMRACGVADYAAYLDVLARQPGELDLLADALTINVTTFFRNRETWDWLGSHLLPDLLRERDGRLRAWSAGCASGEEPYTLVMLIAGILEELARPEWLSRIRIDATDIDRRSLERAAAADYPEKAFAEVDPVVRARCCVPAGHGRLTLRADLRAQVDVHRLELTSGRDAGLVYDLILCRNVVIYFDRDTQERLMQRFAEQLTPGGVLVLGKVETIVGPARGLFHLVEPRERIYRKAA
jgi:chemotaxis methyl-accepting protein methylase